MSKLQLSCYKKNGKRLGKQRYKCNDCSYVFENKRKSSKLQLDLIWNQYVFENQTYTSLSKQYNVSSKTIKRRLDRSIVSKPNLEPGDAVVIMDTTYFRRDFGVMVFRDHLTKKNLHWRYVKYETIAGYKAGITHLKSLGWNILAIVCDGRRGIFSSFRDTPVQMCQRHQAAIIRRYITKNPRLDASKELNQLILNLTNHTKVDFSESLSKWYEKWKTFLNEKTYREDARTWHYTHKRLRSAYRSLKTNFPKLFTYLDYPNLNIPNTTNSIEGCFSNLKTKLRVHSGINRKRKTKIIDEILAK